MVAKTAVMFTRGYATAPYGTPLQWLVRSKYQNGLEMVCSDKRPSLEYISNNVTARFKKCKQLFEYQHLLLLEISGGQSSNLY